MVLDTPPYTVSQYKKDKTKMVKHHNTLFDLVGIFSHMRRILGRTGTKTAIQKNRFFWSEILIKVELR